MNGQSDQTVSSLPERDIDLLVVQPQTPARSTDATANLSENGSLIVLENGQAVEYVPYWQPGQIRRHDLLLGTVTRRMPQLGGVFVEVGTSHDGLLRLSAGETAPAEGGRVIVTVLREAQPGKGPILTQNIAIPSRFAVLRPGQNPLRRSLLKQFSPEEAERLFKADLERLTASFQAFQSAAETGPAPRCLLAAGDPLLVLVNAWPHRIRSIQVEGTERFLRVEQLLKSAAPDLLPRLMLHPEHRTYDLAAVHRQSGLGLAVGQRQVRLNSGGTLVIDKTEALHVIDVNSGSAAGRDKSDLADRINREAIGEIARQIRLRNLTGMIVIDLIHQRDQTRQTVYVELLKQSLSGDRGKATVYGFSALSLLEMIRTAP